MLKKPAALHAGAAALAALAVLSVWPALGRVEAVSEHRGGSADAVNLQYSTIACIGQGECLMEGTDLNTLLLQAPAVTCSDPEALITGVQRQGAGMELHCALSAPAEGQYLLLPISYAPGFSAFVNGEEVPLLLYGNNQLRAELPCAEGDVEVRYTSLTLFRLSEAVSLAALAGCGLWPLGGGWAGFFPPGGGAEPFGRMCPVLFKISFFRPVVRVFAGVLLAQGPLLMV